jgi:hypothetical protein
MVCGCVVEELYPHMKYIPLDINHCAFLYGGSGRRSCGAGKLQYLPDPEPDYST